MRVKEGKRIEHLGVKIELIGEIDLPFDRGSRSEFLALSQELSAAGEIRQISRWDFEFRNVEKAYESYVGTNVKLRYSKEIIKR